MCLCEYPALSLVNGNWKVWGVHLGQAALGLGMESRARATKWTVRANNANAVHGQT